MRTWERIEGRVAELARRAGLRGIEPRVLVAAAVLAVAAVAWAVWRWAPVPAPADFEVATAAESSFGKRSGEGTEAALTVASVEATAPSTLFVHVAGAVRRPGVVELPAGARVVDAVEAAGGALADAVLDGVNLARPVTDGEQVYVPDEDAVRTAGGLPTGASGAGGPGSTAAGGHAGAGSGGSVVNVNTADQAALETLPGVGPATALKIIAERESNGPFETVEDLRRVPGIGEKKLEAMRESVSVR